jgi:Cys-tRNA(Pro)/Cys-tRNA(Cys) deacylase
MRPPGRPSDDLADRGPDRILPALRLGRLRVRRGVRLRPQLTAPLDPDTPALRALAGTDLRFEMVRTVPARSAEESAELQGIPVGNLLRTIVIRRGADDYVFVLVPGGRQIDWARLRAVFGVKRLSLPDQAEAQDATGYERGAITPFGSKRAWPVVADATVPDLGWVAIGGGARGVNLHVDGADLVRHLDAQVADVTRPAG